MNANVAPHVLRPRRSRERRIVIVVAGLAVSCATGPPFSSRYASEPCIATLPASYWAQIEDGATARELVLRHCSRRSPDSDGYWLPERVCLQDIDAALPRVLAHLRPDLRPTAPASYLRQYAGVTQGTRRLVYVNVAQQWEGEPVSSRELLKAADVCDGGGDFVIRARDGRTILRLDAGDGNSVAGELLPRAPRGRALVASGRHLRRPARPDVSVRVHDVTAGSRRHQPWREAAAR